MSTALAEPVQTETSVSHRVEWHLLIVVAIAFAFRFGWVLLGHKYRFTGADHFDFGQENGCIARSLASGLGFSSPFPEQSGPTTWIAPVYPFLTALVFKIFGIYSTASALVMLAINCAASALTCVPLFAIARRVANRRIALVSCWIWAITPLFMVWAIDWIWDASVTTFVMTLIVWLTIRLGDEVTLSKWLGFGLFWGFAALLNPSLLSTLPFTVAYIAWKARVRGQRWLLPAAMCCALVVLTVTPWLVRNYMAFGKFVFIRGNFWAEMRFGNSIYGDGTWLGFTHPELNRIERDKYLRLGEQGYFDSKKADFLQFVHEYPNYFGQLCFRRVLLYWWDFNDINPDTTEVLKAIARRVFSTLALVGIIFLLIKRRPAAALMASILIVFPLPYYLTYPYGRYRHVIEPLLVICAVYALAHVREFKKAFATDSAD